MAEWAIKFSECRWNYMANLQAAGLNPAVLPKSET